MIKNRVMSNQVFEVARTVLAVREYQDRDVPLDVVRRIVDAGRLTASAANRQPWHFVVIRDHGALRKLGQLVRTGPYIAQSAFAVVAAYEKGSRFGFSDVSRAIQTMILTAWAEGVGSNWTGSPGMESVREEVGFPDTYEVAAVVPFGYPSRTLGKGRKNRKPAAEVVSGERFGTPFE